ncbi:sodium:solute symporter [Chondrinema litorale]|uniref:sodium:solute symporter n=1 Tax=Chondrinema litorale TaxID=2994555 RepID=UPI002543962F|nr:sodium:solute symporter [Chondrinema litorale]UZR92985.1 sodium:solute symporter [Chondrinema litorale]
MEKFELNWIDASIMVVYAIAMVWYGLSKAKQQSSEDYFLAGRDMTWPIVGISLFAANISSSTLIGLTSDAYNTNIAVYNYEWMAAVVLIFFSIFFLPFYLRSGVYTMPEFLERRYDSRSRYYFSFITLIGNVVIDTAAGLYAGNLILKIIFPELDTWIIISLLAFAAAAYTIPGGLSSVVHTEVIQAILLIMGSIVLTWFTFSEVGGWDGLIAGLQDKFNNGEIQKTPDEVFSLVRPLNDSYMPWTGLVFGVPILGFYFWANNQFMVQRVLSAKNLNQGRWGALFAGLLKLPVIFIMVLPGTAAILLYSELDLSVLNYAIPLENGGTGICSSLKDCPNMTYPVLLFSLLPTGLLGLVLAGLLAAMSSSISATLNSASTLITMDFVNKINPNLESKQLVKVGQIATVVLVILAAVWTPQIEKFGSLFEYLQIVLGLICPPVVAVFILGLFWKRANANGAFYSLLVGFILALFMIISQIGGLIPELNEIHFLHKAPILLLVCLLLHVVFSLASAKPPAEKVKDYTYSMTIFKEETKELATLPWYQNFRYLAVILLVITIIIVGAFW